MGPLKKYFIGLMLIVSALFIATADFIPETNNPANKVMKLLSIFFVFLLAGLGFYFGRESAKELAQKDYENRPFEFNSLEPWKPYKVLSMKKLKAWTLFLLGPINVEPEDIDYTENITYVRAWNEHLPKGIEQGSIISRQKFDKIYIMAEDTKKT